MITDRLGILKDVIKVFKCKSEAVVYVMNGVFYCINTELSLIKTFKPKDGVYDPLIVNTLCNTIHRVECINNLTEIPMDTNGILMDNLIYETYNPYIYEFEVYRLKKMYTDILFNMISIINDESSISIHVESDDFVNDSAYTSVFDDLFNLGTGIGVIFKAVRNPEYCFTIYKGLIPYNKADKVQLKFIDDIFKPKDGPDRFYTNFKVIKPRGILDVYTRNIKLTVY